MHQINLSSCLPPQKLGMVGTGLLGLNNCWASVLTAGLCAQVRASARARDDQAASRQGAALSLCAPLVRSEITAGPALTACTQLLHCT